MLDLIGFNKSINPLQGYSAALVTVENGRILINFPFLNHLFPYEAAGLGES
jgi:hypothetical protein